MRRNFGRLFLVVPAVFMLFVPLSARADTVTAYGVAGDTLAVSQVITIHATVLPAREIILNDQYQMIDIFSNTAEDVTPTVYLNATNSQKLPLTPALLAQYETVISHTKQTVGVEIPVPLPVYDSLSSPSLRDILFQSVSSLLKSATIL